MSLLMQALKKAERAKQSHAHGEEPAKPSEAFDQMLALAPQPPAPHHELTLELAALSPEPAADRGPALSPVDAAAQVPEAEPVAALADTQAGRAADAHETPRGPRNVPPPPQMPRPAVRRPALSMPEPRTIRLLTLAGMVLLIAAVFGYIYWRAVYGPGSSRNLPMVPMPGQDFAAPAPAAPGYPPAAIPYPANTDYPPANAASAYPAPATVNPAPATAPAPAPQPAPPVNAQAVPPASPQAKAPLAKAAPVPTAQEEISRIKQENLDRAERMERMLEMGDPNRRRGPPPPPYVPPAASLAAVPASTSGATNGGAADAGGVASATPAAAYAATAQPAYGAPADSSGIRVAHSSTPERVNPALLQGYAAFIAGDFGTARQQYQSVLQHDTNNRDALLGVAALALRERQPEQAAAVYTRLLAINPNDADALAGLAGLRSGDPDQTEGQLRRMLAQSPESPSLLFALGNLYARQGRWQEAQQQFFKAYSNAPENADYAFNLAVGLDRLGQRKLALGYYQRALALNPGGAVSFERSAAAARVRALGGQ